MDGDGVCALVAMLCYAIGALVCTEGLEGGDEMPRV